MSLYIADWLPALMTYSHLALSVGFIAWVLMSKSDSTSALAWCMLIMLLPFFGPLIFLLFGYQHVNRPLQRKRRHMEKYRSSLRHAVQASPGIVVTAGVSDSAGAVLTRLADRFGAYPRRPNNHVDFFHDGPPAFEAMLEALHSARHHIHLEFFIFHADDIGRQFLEVMAAKARAGVQVRMIYDAMGSHSLSWRALADLLQGGGKSSVFLPISLLRRRFQINMRNHRKILVVDGQVGFTGGLNVGDEYLGKDPGYGYWRDTHMRIRGPAVEDLQRIFCEDWDFAAGQRLADSELHASASSRCYFPGLPGEGTVPMQVIDSGPDREFKSIREIYFAAIVNAQKRVWIASPYFVPDAGLLDALRLAGYRGIDVRFLGQLYPDKWIPQFAARYHWDRVLRSGVNVYQYGKGMMHAKVVLVDGQWASVGTANLDNRSLHLNFEVNCLIDSPQAVTQLEEQFLRDLTNSIQLQPQAYARRPFAGRLLENACRLLSPVL